MNRLKQGKIGDLITEIKTFTMGRRDQDCRQRSYPLRNAKAGRLDYANAREQSLPNGSDIIKSTVRRVLNLRLKGASLVWTKDNAERMIFLRSHYKAGHWKVLEHKALTCTTKIAA
ncbi:MAG: hypothetical protein R3C28_26660 [Pirellulaceae bacterium]